MPSENNTGHAEPSLWIAGLGSQYPPFIAGPEKFDNFAKNIYGTGNAGYVAIVPHKWNLC